MQGVLPPTSHDLLPSQHARLVRSNRKLQDVLGVTPQISEGQSLRQHNPKKLALTLVPTSAPGKLTLNITGPPRERGSSISISDLLNIASNTIRRIPGRGRPRSSSLASLLEFARAAPPSPTSPAALYMTRRRRMAKLTRTFGEKIPQELVCTVEGASPLPTAKGDVDNHLGVAFPSEVTPIVVSLDGDVAPPQVLTKSYSMPTTVTKGSSDIDSPAPARRAESVRPTRRRRLTEGWAHRKEAGWSGEWSSPDQEEVLNRLRRL
ncbi:hypothetical protein CYLTODRAFT_427698 [Cylindrobasidium torrendii FP15055 ss-10]|uniref:Uncharacterized protein n=1 Tax=Cylindrobasidium torrendii FP15055 ss-10 TaxID=1314674 RepID=A0A0D7AUV8_9AGAR|nr:hypothetical protein CYLTODRAFT_427698 [Cylindrobasidium torrendii FP15055 ss-10]